MTRLVCSRSLRRQRVWIVSLLFLGLWCCTTNFPTVRRLNELSTNHALPQQSTTYGDLEHVKPKDRKEASQASSFSEHTLGFNPLEGHHLREDHPLWQTPPQNDKCGAMFGNGFQEAFDFCTSSPSLTQEGMVLSSRPEASNITCYWSETLAVSLCQAHNLLIDRDRITVSQGGEPIEEVDGRAESDEEPHYLSGALQASCSIVDVELTAKHFPCHHYHLMSSINNHSHASIASDDFSHNHLNLRLIHPNPNPNPNPNRCEAWHDGPVLLVTRIEYANLFHTMTDWYNTYQTMRWAGLNPADVTVLFQDGRSASAMDEVWSHLFGTVGYVKHAKDRRTCYQNVYFVPAGYESALSASKMQTPGRACNTSPMLADFIQYFLNAFSESMSAFESESTMVEDVAAALRITYLFRRDYIAHPHKNGRHPASRKVANEMELVNATTHRFPNAHVESVYFDGMSFAEQLSIIRKTNILIGVHGAGLSHVLFMRLSTDNDVPSQVRALIELRPPSHLGHFHFSTFATYIGLKYASVTIGNALKGTNKHPVDVEKVLSQVADILDDRPG